jgi:hypothetical protein
MQATSVVHEAVIFFEQGRAAKEMLYAEFEAVLDGVVSLPEYAGRVQRAAWVGVDAALRVRECVLFLIGFDHQGKTDRRWNVPLRHLASQAGAGPDLGAGPIRLACRSQCPVSWHAESLWDADRRQGVHPLRLVRDAITANRLGLRPAKLAEEAVPVVAVSHQVEKQLARFNERHDRELREAGAIRRQLQLELDALRSANESLASQNEMLRQHIVTEARRYEAECLAMREQVMELREQWRLQSEELLTQRVGEETQRLRQAIELRDQELRHQYELAREMRDELYRLRQGHERIPGEDTEWLDDAGEAQFRH